MSETNQIPESGAQVFLQEDRHDLIVVGQGMIIKPKHGYLSAPQSVIAEADLASLTAAVRNEERCCASIPETILVARCSESEFDEYLFDADPVSLEIGPTRVYAKFEVLVGPDRLDTETYKSSLQPAAERYGCRVAETGLLGAYGREIGDFGDLPWTPEELEELQEEAEGQPMLLTVRVEPTRPMKVASLLSAGRDSFALLDAIKGGPLNIASAVDLLHAGLPHLLVGLPESEWLEVKSHPYSLTAHEKLVATAAKIELAQDVARFANSSSAALLVIGLATTKRDGIEVVTRVTPASLPALDPQQHRDVIDKRVYPVVEGLSVEQVKLGGGRGLLFIHIPSQPEEYKPFLVHGAVVAERGEGAFISIVRRRGDGSIPITASQVHATLAAGRALLRHGPSSRHSSED